MKKIFTILGLGVIVALAASCEKGLVETSAPETEKTVTLSFTASMDSEMTRTTIDGKKVMWEAGDKIGLFVYNYKVVDDHNLGDPSNFPLYAVGHDNGYRAGFTSTGGPNYKYMSDPLSVGGESATFTFTLSTTDANRVKNADYYVAVFPYREGVDENEIAYYTCYADKAVNTSTYTHAFLRYIFPEEQTNSSVQIAYAYSTNNQLAFQNLNSLIKFNTANTAVKKAVLTGNNGETLSNSRLEYTYDSGTYKAYSGATAITSITNTDVKTGDNFFALKPGVTLSNGFTITLYDSSDKEVGSFVYGSSYTTARNKLTSISNFDSRAATELPGKANCYIVTTPGRRYRFDPGDVGTLFSKSDIASVEVIWETENTDTAPGIGSIISDVAYQDGYIFFSVPDNNKQGNALIGAKKSNGIYAWSWHIWRLDSAPADVTITNVNGDEAIFMDRNLGALSANPADGYLTYGLYYQWGNKNPYLGNSGQAPNFNPGSGLIFFNRASAADAFNTCSGLQKTTNAQYLSYIKACPTKMLYIDDGTGTTMPSGDRWSFWNYSTPSGYTVLPSKGYNDPCPAGYAVPVGGSHTSITGASPSSVDVNKYGWFTGGNSNYYDSEPYGCYIDGSFFPAAGYANNPANNSFQKYKRDAGYYHTVAPNGQSGFYFSIDHTYYYPIATNYTMDYRNAKSVRCQKL